MRNSTIGNSVPQPGPNVPLWSFCAVLIVIAFKHFVADFMLQTNWIAHGKERNEGWLAPLTVHVLCHAALTLGLALVIAPRLWWLAIVDLAVHATIDRGKTVVAHRGGWSMTQAQFWWLIGGDQWLHQVTNVGIAAAFFAL